MKRERTTPVTIRLTDAELAWLGNRSSHESNLIPSRATRIKLLDKLAAACPARLMP